MLQGSRSALEHHADESQKQHIALLSGLAARQQRQIVGLRTALAKLSLNTSGTLIWRISDLAAKMAEAKTREGVELLSPIFLTSQYGYKLQASVFLNGNGAGDGSHISVYIKILPGDYDALLRWPFAHSVSFTIFDQASVPDKVGFKTIFINKN
jgi:TNF receptor-associated factor 4